MEERTGWRGQNESQVEVADLLVPPRPAKSVQMTQASAEKLEHTGPAEKESVASVPHREQLASTPELPLP